MEQNLELAAHNFTVFMLGGAIIVCAVIGFLIAFIFYYRNKQIQHQKEKDLLKFEYEGALLRTQVEIAEETLKKVSNEIHDNVLQRLTLTKMNLSGDVLSQSDKIKNAHDLLNEALLDLRNMSHMLNGSYVLKMGLENAIRHELDMISKSSNIETGFEVRATKDEGSLNEQQEIIVFRCIQEGLNNAVKYSSCSRLSVNIDEGEDFTVITIEDNGSGFDPVKASKGLGIASMKERIAILGGELEIQSETDKGSKLIFIVPHDSLKFRTEKKIKR